MNPATGTDALFGVVQAALTIGSLIPLLLGLVALVLFLRTRRALPGAGAGAGAGPVAGTAAGAGAGARSRSRAGAVTGGRGADDVAARQRAHDLARVALLGSAFGLALLLVGQLVLGLGTSIGLVNAFAGPLVPLNIAALTLTVVSAVAYAASPSPGR
ncbi:hypothetical protein ASF17_08845 [Frigoribacterium sp. Leaf263]|uniref:hypothetical protein n=1 Tax=Frigoribacterium sp. Leaf263 TaxID=1736313 RepID=UPI0007007C3D|nr:hypothetical protein [Frigoribacterium sp. Leaf263]KQO83053.1 hypothetical protein ASF17_08845 [Frigoribacterium sp. Leaf263]